jgi:hypothetical protein
MLSFYTHHDSNSFFCNVNTFLLSEEFPQNIILYFINEWK